MFASIILKASCLIWQKERENKMLNQIVIVGRIVEMETIETENTNKQMSTHKVIITLAVPRSYKNINGEYDTDFIPCTLWNGIAENTTQYYCKKGDLVGIKGRLQSNEDKSMIVVAEKVTFLSNRKEEQE